MHSGLQYVFDICRKQNISRRQLEKECGFSNGYLDPKKIKKIPYERAVLIADFLKIDVTDVLTGPDAKKAPTQEGERTIENKNVVRIAGRDGSFVTKVLTDEQLQAVKAMIDLLPDASDDL